MSDFDAVFISSSIVMFIVFIMFLLTLKKAREIEKKLK